MKIEDVVIGQTYAAHGRITDRFVLESREAQTSGGSPGYRVKFFYLGRHEGCWTPQGREWNVQPLWELEPYEILEWAV